MVFKSFDGIEKGADGGEIGFGDTFSMGNIGFPENLCKKAPLVWDSEETAIDLYIECQGGT